MSLELIGLIIGIVIIIFTIVYFFLKRNNEFDDEEYIEYEDNEEYENHHQEILKLKDEIIRLKDDFNLQKIQLLENSQKEIDDKNQTIHHLEQKLTEQQAKLEQQLLAQQAQFEQQLTEQQAQFKITLGNEIKQAQKRSNDAQRNVIKGQMAERFVPFMNGFSYNPSDCRFLGEPIDYIIFHNLHQCADGEVGIDEVAIVFLEIKTGNAKLQKRQEILKQVILNGQIEFETLRIDNDNPIVTIDKNASTTLNSQYAHEECDDEDVNRVGQKWTTDEEERLIESFELGLPISEIANLHGRKVGGIRSRLRKLGKIE